MRRTYRELSKIDTFEERFRYLKLLGEVGMSTFGFDRWINQAFYTSNEWRRARRDIIARDLGCDLGLAGHEIYDKIIIHHMNPMTPKDIEDGSPDILNPEYLISVSLRTHNAIHFGDESLLPKELVPRAPGDTKLW